MYPTAADYQATVTFPKDSLQDARQGHLWAPGPNTPVSRSVAACLGRALVVQSLRTRFDCTFVGSDFRYVWACDICRVRIDWVSVRGSRRANTEDDISHL